MENSYTLVTVPKSGHFIPADNYAASKSYLDDFVKAGVLECKNTVTMCTIAKGMCSALSDCFESDGYGKCGANG